MFAFENQAAIDLVGENHYIAISDDLGDVPYLIFVDYSARRILRRIEDNHFSAVINQSRQFVNIESKVPFFLKPDWYRPPAGITNHRLVNGKPWIRIDDFVAF